MADSKESIKNLNLKKWAKQGAVFVVLFLLLVFSFSLFTSKQYDGWKTARVEKESALNQLNDVTGQLESIETMTLALEDISSTQEEKLDHALPETESVEDLLTNMHKLSEQSGLLITSIFVQPQPVAETEVSLELRRLSMEMTVRGRYQNLLSFLTSLERYVRLVDINTITISRVSSAADTLETLQVAIQGQAYFLGEIPEAPLFPYGQMLDLSLLDDSQYRSMQVITVSLPTNVLSQPNPFAPR